MISIIEKIIYLMPVQMSVVRVMAMTKKYINWRQPDFPLIFFQNFFVWLWVPTLQTFQCKLRETNKQTQNPVHLIKNQIKLNCFSLLKFTHLSALIHVTFQIKITAIYYVLFVNWILFGKTITLNVMVFCLQLTRQCYVYFLLLTITVWSYTPSTLLFS